MLVEPGVAPISLTTLFAVSVMVSQTWAMRADLPVPETPWRTRGWSVAGSSKYLLIRVNGSVYP
ncbi:MAG: hypothetical protein WB290_13855, partial [Smithella sp.]